MFVNKICSHPNITEIQLELAINTNQSCYLQRLTQSNPQQRDSAMVGYRDNDLLGCSAVGPHRVS